MKLNSKIVWIPVIAVSIGYFVDLFDLMLFSSVRIASLKELNIIGDDATKYASDLMNKTVLGMVIGGIVWGIIADKFGRLTVLFASILTYTIANFINAYIQDIQSYQICRFIAGFGIAGELGVGITLISEQLKKINRTNAILIVSAFGMLGAVFAGLLTNILADKIILGLSSWRFLFIVGGILGILVLFFRVSIQESILFKNVKNTDTKGNLFFLFSSSDRAFKFLFCVLSGLPIFFIIGNLITLSSEYGKRFGLDQIKPSTAVVWCYLSIAIFDIVGTYLSKRLKSRKKVIYIFLVIQTISIIVYLFTPSYNTGEFYAKCGFLGMGIGLWGVLIVNSAEQFGTNLRATVTTMVPNLIRGALFLLSKLLFDPLKENIGITSSSAITLGICLLIAFISTSQLEDKFENDLDFEETNIKK